MTARFGISTHLFHGERLASAHVAAVAEHGFGALEVYATRTHVDYHDPAALAALGTWLAEAGIGLHSVHAPTTTEYVGGRWGETLSIGSADEGRRQLAVAETVRSLEIAATVPFGYLVVHLGVPSQDSAANSRTAIARSLETIAEAAEPLGVTLALELIPNPLSIGSRLVQWLEEDLDLGRAGICLDVGHAHIVGDVMEAVETCSGHIVTTHLHDNDGRRDDHRMPGQGTIDWDGTMMAFQKVGYDGVLVFELAPAADWRGTLARAAAARSRLAGLLEVEG